MTGIQKKADVKWLTVPLGDARNSSREVCPERLAGTADQTAAYHCSAWVTTAGKELGS